MTCELAVEALGAGGTIRIRVQGTSMVPSIWPGDTVIIERLAGRCLSRGEIALFSRQGRLFVHRVVSAAGEPPDLCLITRGDAMVVADPCVSGAELLGRVSRIIHAGRCIEPSARLTRLGRLIAGLAQRSGQFVRLLMWLRALS